MSRRLTCAVALLLALGTCAGAAAAPPPPFVGPCSFEEGFDCNGQDMQKVPGPEKDMTQEKCCSLCKAKPGCKVAVLATGWQHGVNLCELKSGCTQPNAMAHRVKCCLPGAGKELGCHAPAPPPPPVCNATALPTFCDASKPIDERVAELVGAMTAQEKIDQVGSNDVPSIGRLGIPAYQWWGEAQHGVCESPSVQFRPPTPVGTSFPEPGLTGATFDRELFGKIGDVIGKEGRAMANAGNAGLTFWAPNINIVRDPRWGRLLETPGECPYLTTQYAINFIKGVQGVDPSGRGYLQAASTPKHYAGYNLDNWHGMDRYHYNAVINRQDWADTYSQPFQASVVGANASGLMCSYNAMTLHGYPASGVPTCADTNLLTKLARETFGFDGYITGDCGAAQDVWSAHKFGGDAAGAAAASLTAGMDVDCGSFVKNNGMEALNSGKLSSAALDSAVGHLFRLRIRLGYFDPAESTPWGNASHLDLNYSAHFETALRAAREGIVLLSHKRNVLPLKAKIKLAVSGPNADNAANMQGIDCHGVPPYLITPIQGLGNFSTLSYPGPGCSMGKKNDTAGFAAVATAAAAADATVLVLGLDPSIEYEMRDRTDLLLPGSQAALVASVRSAMGADKPLIVVLMGGGVIDTSPIDALVDAVLWCGYPGQAGGQAIAEIIFGKVVPSGRSPLTWYANEYASDASPTAVSMLDMGMRPSSAAAVMSSQGSTEPAGPYPLHGPNPGRTYRFVSKPEMVRYEFGHGLTIGASFSYGSLALSDAHTSAASIDAVVTAADAPRERYKAPTLLSVSVTVSNSGKRAAGHSLLLFASPPNAGKNGSPIKSLVGFERLPLVAAGGKATVTVALTAWSLALANAEGVWGAAAGAWTLSANTGGHSEVGVSATLTVE